MAELKPITITCPACGETLTAPTRMTMLRTILAPLVARARLSLDATSIASHFNTHHAR